MFLERPFLIFVSVLLWWFVRHQLCKCVFIAAICLINKNVFSSMLLVRSTSNKMSTRCVSETNYSKHSDYPSLWHNSKPEVGEKAFIWLRIRCVKSKDWFCNGVYLTTIQNLSCLLSLWWCHWTKEQLLITFFKSQQISVMSKPSKWHYIKRSLLNLQFLYMTFIIFRTRRPKMFYSVALTYRCLSWCQLYAQWYLCLTSVH